MVLACLLVHRVGAVRCLLHEVMRALAAGQEGEHERPRPFTPRLGPGKITVICFTFTLNLNRNPTTLTSTITTLTLTLTLALTLANQLSWIQERGGIEHCRCFGANCVSEHGWLRHCECVLVQGKFQLLPSAPLYYPFTRVKSILGVIYGVGRAAANDITHRKV